MKVTKVKQNSPEWFQMRLGKVTGSKPKDLITKRGNTVKKGVFRLIADKLEDIQIVESYRERGHDLEPEAIAEVEKYLGVVIDTDMFWESEEYPGLALSPDGGIATDGIYTEAVEIKCLDGANHLEAVITNEVPNDYIDQAVHYFLVNPDLKVLHFAFYHPAIPSKKLHVIRIAREQMEQRIKENLESILGIQEYVDEWVERLAF